MKTDPSTLLV